MNLLLCSGSSWWGDSAHHCCWILFLLCHFIYSFGKGHSHSHKNKRFWYLWKKGPQPQLSDILALTSCKWCVMYLLACIATLHAPCEPRTRFSLSLLLQKGWQKRGNSTQGFPKNSSSLGNCKPDNLALQNYKMFLLFQLPARSALWKCTESRDIFYPLLCQTHCLLFTTTILFLIQYT